MNISFRLCSQADIVIANSILVKAYNFANNREALLRHYWSLQPDGWWLAFADETPVGFGGAVNYGLFSYVGMVCVLPTMQRRGIGQALMIQILEWEKKRNGPTILLEANQKAVSLYKRLGFFEEGSTFPFSLKEPVKGRKASPGVALFQKKDTHELTLFDAIYFGAERQKIFVSHLIENQDRAFIARDGAEKIVGYIFAQSHSLGPWVAQTPDIAERLLLHALTLSFNGGVSNTIPDANEEGIKLLQRYGFRESTPSIHMRLGPPISSMQRAMIYGQASMAVG